MAEDESELEKRAVEELLRETDRARLRAETMGPAGWLKCPLRGTNKRFLLNTLRSTGLRPGEPKAEQSSHAARRESPAGRSRSRSPPAGRDGGRSRKRHRANTSSSDVKRRDGDRERSRGRKGERDETAEKDRRTSKASAN
ncbi:protein POLR1D-like [Phycodurus eques]|uniref:protein POLR1D-like n=1 Tax=Phycodurus eques TaxID=693459 RepID=UPI002ACD522E|nr:protein POLR1D-like [Phycodurus eques]